MQITRIEVTKLFGRFDHSIELREDEPITIMIGPNGFGKTTILRMVDAVFSQSIRRLARLPFGELAIFFDTGPVLRAIRTPADGKKRSAARIDFSLTPDHDTQRFRLDTATEPDFPLSVVDRVIGELDRVSESEWRNLRTGETLDLDDVMDRYADQLPSGKSAPGRLPEWLVQIRESLSVRFIDAERLIVQPAGDVRQMHAARVGGRFLGAAERTVKRYAEELGEQVKKTLAEYGSLSQSLDRTFPARLVEEPVHSGMPLDRLRQELSEVEERRARLVSAGLLRQDHPYWGVAVPDLDKVDESRRSVLAVYASDARKKLAVFDDLYARVVTLTDIANSRLLHKRLTIGADGLSVETPEGAELKLEMLSSGEQHELVLLYELLFKARKNSLILIDEPELSLHVAWQEEFLSDLTKMAELSDFRALLATHSPQIIGDRWDLTVELKAPNGR